MSALATDARRRNVSFREVAYSLISTNLQAGQRHAQPVHGYVRPLSAHLQAPIGSAADEALVTAVARAGGMGSIAMTWTEPDKGLASAALLRARNIPYFFNFVLRFGTAYPSRYVEAGLRAVTLSWGIDADLIAQFKSGGTKVGVQVGSTAGAIAALAAGADFLIVQGIEAGGHVQSSTPLARLLDETIAIAGATPVIAAGGIATGADIARAMKAGAQGVMMGTRFIASDEFWPIPPTNRRSLPHRRSRRFTPTASTSAGPTPCRAYCAIPRLRCGKQREAPQHPIDPVRETSSFAAGMTRLSATATRLQHWGPKATCWPVVSMPERG